MTESPSVIDASVLVDLLAETEIASAVRSRLRGSRLHAPAHLDLEVLSAMARLRRAGHVTTEHVERGISAIRSLPVTRHGLTDLLDDAWQRRDGLRISDALYVALAERLSIPLLTTDLRLARAYPSAESLGS